MFLSIKLGELLAVTEILYRYEEGNRIGIPHVGWTLPIAMLLRI